MTSLAVLQAVKGEKAIVTTEELEARRQNNLEHFKPETSSILERVRNELNRIFKKDN